MREEGERSEESELMVRLKRRENWGWGGMAKVIGFSKEHMRCTQHNHAFLICLPFLGGDFQCGADTSSVYSN